ncbi:2-polyprenylphenol 6-hydroxylase [Limibacillus halophilus]|uniref:Ubiquinone biosynthesis protein n=1 Tax=Limibacillus halophilus TaxID=1579333 RepID=A0A839SR43_9PROT|nr:2-polyprenylphenol 6-hydroxylase [Limibacillus halophilus]MBB3065271.1 ubiquinone biosynthesis protein [Limibacillus halophilus]
MRRSLRSFYRLFTIARTLARHDALAFVEDLGIAPGLCRTLRFFSPRRKSGRPGQKLASALTELGPSFVKLGQFLSTRADLLGEEVALDLAELQDHLPPFPSDQARRVIERELGQPVATLFSAFSEEAVSAASIAQVHFAVTSEGEEVAVKILRPQIERAFRRDLDLFYWLANLSLRAQPRLARLKPVDLVRLFEEQVTMEMDLRLEAAAASELAENFEHDPTYVVPHVDWERTARRVLTTTRLSGIPLDDREALLAAGHDLEEVLTRAAATFFNQVFRDGFFHGDQHPGNMFVDSDGNIGAVDFGIMGRLDHETRMVLADMLLAVLAKDYRRLAQVQVDAGFLPAGRPLDSYVQALRSVCEPIFGKPLAEISFANLLTQLFQLTESFELEVQPQLTLLQKNMMMAEGVSRVLDPRLNIWSLAEPLIADWVARNRGAPARAREGLQTLEATLRRIPRIVENLERATKELANDGLRLAPQDSHRMRWSEKVALAAAFTAAILALFALLD